MKVLVIGSSGGIGAAVHDYWAAAGHAVTGLSRSGDGLDVTDPASVAAVLGAQDGPFERVFVATGILAAKGHAPEKSLEAIDGDAMARVMAVNVIGTGLILRHLPDLLPRTGHSVTGILTARVGSIGDNHIGGWYSYRASKAAANMLVHGAAIEIGRKRKQAVVAALHPGTVATRFTADYPGHKKVSPETAAANLAGVMDALTPEQSGGFFDYAGKEIPW